MPVTVTDARFEELRTVRGGITNATIRALGVPFPLRSGWPARIIGTIITDEQWTAARAGRDKLAKRKTDSPTPSTLHRPARPPTYTPIVGIWFGDDGQLVLDTGTGNLLTLAPDRVDDLATALADRLATV